MLRKLFGALTRLPALVCSHRPAEWFSGAKRWIATAGFVIATLSLVPTVAAQGVVYRTYSLVNAYDPITNRVVTYRPVVRPAMTYLPAVNVSAVQGDAAFVANRPVATYAPVVTYKPVTSYEPITTYRPVTTYEPITTYAPVTTYAAEVITPTIVLRPVYVPGQPIRNVWRALLD